jgi:hypothetical protein
MHGGSPFQSNALKSITSSGNVSAIYISGFRTVLFNYPPAELVFGAFKIMWRGKWASFNSAISLRTRLATLKCVISGFRREVRVKNPDSWPAEDGTDRLSRNVGMELPHTRCAKTQKSAVFNKKMLNVYPRNFATERCIYISRIIPNFVKIWHVIKTRVRLR